MKYIILGLGNFGSALARQLTKLGHEVIGVDKHLEKVERLKESVTHTVSMDCTDRNAVSSLPLKQADAVVVAIGEDEGASLLTTALMKQLQVKRIIGRVVSDLQQTVLEAMDIHEYIMPEVASAERLALRLDNIGVVDSFKISERHSIIEAVVPERYVGMTLGEARLTNEYKVLVLTTIKAADRRKSQDEADRMEVTGIAKSDTLLEKGDVLVLFGERDDIFRLID